jgi:hypothetical protein
MPLRLPCLPIQLTPGSLLLHSYWGSMGYYRPICTVYVVGPHLLDFIRGMRVP